MTHTLTPWHQGPYYKTDIYSRSGLICECRPMGTDKAVADAAYIVRACNAHDELLAALKAIVGLANETIDGAGHRYTFDYRSPLAVAARAAIAKAEKL